MSIIRYIVLSLFAFSIMTPAIYAQETATFTKEQQQIATTLKKEYAAYIKEHHKDFNQAKVLQQQFIKENQAQLQQIIALEEQFRKENQAIFDKLKKAREEFQTKHPELKVHHKENLSTKKISNEEKYNFLYMKLLHGEKYGLQQHSHHMHHQKSSAGAGHKEVQGLHKQFMEENKATFEQLKAAREKFNETHKKEWDTLQASFHTYYKKHEAALTKAHSLKKQFIEQHQQELLKLGPAAPHFFREFR